MESRIGSAAGKVWEVLSRNGNMTASELVKATKLKAEVVNRAIGWLAREGKLEAQTEGRQESFKLKS